MSKVYLESDYVEASDTYFKLREKVQRMSKEWVDYHLTEDIVSGFYARAKEELANETI